MDPITCVLVQLADGSEVFVPITEQRDRPERGSFVVTERRWPPYRPIIDPQPRTVDVPPRKFRPRHTAHNSAGFYGLTPEEELACDACGVDYADFARTKQSMT